MATDPVHSETRERATLTLLETRLRRLEFLLTGASNLDGIPDTAVSPASNDATVTARLATLEASLERLRRLAGPEAALLRDIERIYSEHPDLLMPTPDTKSQDLSTLASVVLGHASIFPETASRLSSLQSLQVPPVEHSAKLAELTPRVAICRLKQAELENEIKTLRERSARCLEWWVKIGVVGINDLWEEWEDRIRSLEHQLTRFEQRKREEAGYM